MARIPLLPRYVSPSIEDRLYREWYAQYAGRGRVDRLHSAMEEAVEVLNPDKINEIMDRAAKDTAFLRERKYRRSLRK